MKECQSGGKFLSDSYLWAPCCNGWYHRNCVESLAKSTGYFFKCALCNNKEVFENEMKKFGVYVPERVRYTLLRFPDICTGALKFTRYILLIKQVCSSSNKDCLHILQSGDICCLFVSCFWGDTFSKMIDSVVLS